MNLRSLLPTVLLALSPALLACGDDIGPKPIALSVAADQRDVIDLFVENIDYPITVTTAADPQAALVGDGSTLPIAITTDLACTECYELHPEGTGYLVRAGDRLGLQYGLAHLFEQLGFGFFHPYHTHIPQRIREPRTGAAFGRTFEPDVQKRILHLHTLHPIEAYYALWEPSEENLRDGRRIYDWIVKNRGNGVQYPALDNIQTGDASEWIAHTKALTDYAHSRGLTVGIGVQLFAGGNLQLAFDLLEEDTTTPRQDIEARLGVLEAVGGIDSLSLSFGEFFGEDPQAFIDNTNLVHEVTQERMPDARVTATVHVGDTDDTRVSFMGENLIYYFLVKFANADIIPLIHTVMFYNLFEDAGGAYHHEDFSEHRDYLLERMANGEHAAYHPETSYWVAFDNSVPVYLPLYVRSRWLDLAQIAESAGRHVDEHNIFATGWEWGYWQNDYMALRMSYQVPDTWQQAIADMFAPLGTEGARAAAIVTELVDAQHEYLIEKRVAAYSAGRDVFIDVGREIDIVSQPDRPSFEEVFALRGAELDAFESGALADMRAYRDRLDDMVARFPASDVTRSPWLSEIADGIEANALRMRFIHANYAAVVAAARGLDPQPAIDDMEASYVAGQNVVFRRHDSMHTHRPDRLIEKGVYFTLYQFGYLTQADQLCYWERERGKVLNMITGGDERVPGCV